MNADKSSAATNVSLERSPLLIIVECLVIRIGEYERSIFLQGCVREDGSIGRNIDGKTLGISQLANRLRACSKIVVNEPYSIPLVNQDPQLRGRRRQAEQGAMRQTCDLPG